MHNSVSSSLQNGSLTPTNSPRVNSKSQNNNRNSISEDDEKENGEEEKQPPQAPPRRRNLKKSSSPVRYSFINVVVHICMPIFICMSIFILQVSQRSNVYFVI